VTGGAAETGRCVPRELCEVLALLHGGVGSTYGAATVSFGRGGETFSAAVGDADLSTVFDLASLTKALCTSLLCMRLVDAGQLDLDEPVLPGVPVRALLSHRSGLPAWRPLFREAVPDRDLSVASDADARQAVIAAAAGTARGALATRVVYSDLGFILLGDFLERRLCERLDATFFRLAAQLGLGGDLGFRPLDFAAQAVPASRCAPTRRETEPRELLRGVVHDDNARAMLGVAGHAGLFGTAPAVARLALAILDAYHDAGSGAQRALGVSAATVRRFFAQPPPLPSGTAATFGLGWDHPEPLLDGAATTSSAGSRWSRDGVGHLGFTGCSLWLEPAARTFVVFLTNRVCVATTSEAERTHAAIKALRPALHDAVIAALGPVAR
jgi:CubicO group peptidase (beta-lactamase class C family)